MEQAPVSSFVMRSTIPRKMVVPLANTTLWCRSLRGVNVTLHDVLERSVVDSAGLLVNETCLVQYSSAKEMSTADRDHVSVWEHVGLLLVNIRSRLELCVVIKTNEAQLLFDIPSNLPLCGGSEGIHTNSLGRHVRGGALNVSNLVCFMRSRFASGFRRASVGKTGCPSGVALSLL